MPEHLKALVVILVPACVAYAFAKAAGAVLFVASMVSSKRAKAARGMSRRASETSSAAAG